MTFKEWFNEDGHCLFPEEGIEAAWNAAIKNTIKQIEPRIEILTRDSMRYQKLRTLNVPQFQDLFIRNIKGDKSFDKLVDELSFDKLVDELKT